MKSCVLFYVLSAWLRIYFVLGLGVCVFVNGETERENAPSICLHHWDESTAKLQSRLMNRDWIHSLVWTLHVCVQTNRCLARRLCVCVWERERQSTKNYPLLVCVCVWKSPRGASYCGCFLICDITSCLDIWLQHWSLVCLLLLILMTSFRA